MHGLSSCYVMFNCANMPTCPESCHMRAHACLQLPLIIAARRGIACKSGRAVPAVCGSTVAYPVVNRQRVIDRPLNIVVL